MVGEYTEEELAKLHEVLYDILAEIKRVCGVLGIPYFIQGGSAIGAFFEKAILPWDDDIDVGLTRENYKRFVKEAPALLGKDYFLQHAETEPHTLYYFCKLMKRGTLFQEKDLMSLPVHQGIFIDIFPYDKVPNNQKLQKVHRDICNFFNCAFMGKEQWRWKHFGKCEIEHPTDRGRLMCLLTRIVCTLMSKKTILNVLSRLQSMFNSCETEYYNMVLYPRDHIAVKDVENLRETAFGPLTVTIPDNVETYLKHHYPKLRRYIPKEEQMNHHPAKLSFYTTKEEKI